MESCLISMAHALCAFPNKETVTKIYRIGVLVVWVFFGFVIIGFGSCVNGGRMIIDWVVFYFGDR